MKDSGLRILYLTNNPSLLSTTLPMQGWVKNLRPTGLMPVIITVNEGSLSKWAKLEKIPIYVQNLNHPNKFKPIHTLIQLCKLLRIVFYHRINLIHCNEQNTFPIGNLISRLTHIPNVVSIHFSMSKEFCDWAFRNSTKVKKIFFTSNANRKHCLPYVSNLIVSKYLTVLRNGIDLRQYSFNLELKNQFLSTLQINHKFIIGVACALRPRKQVEHLIQAVSQIKLKNIIVLIAGNYLPEDLEYGENLIQESKNLLGDRVVFLGHLDELVGFYSSLDLFVNTSVEEACSLSVLQALACSCPVVGYSSRDTVSEQILPGGGEIVPQDDIRALSKAIERFLNDEQLRLDARVVARKRVEDDYDSVKQSDLLMKAYQEILSGPE